MKLHREMKVKKKTLIHLFDEVCKPYGYSFRNKNDWEQLDPLINEKKLKEKQEQLQNEERAIQLKYIELNWKAFAG
eukprot:CAMPEP_0194211514 /NCGR_PEP_ID=MMETSP0156-20130528/10496_1 /TAXON_ID=33649 /ORGANISM="Thalassionema nitzschioides, Strain L26-B" /LENGTH=75 /DNA_ID=CAMNT_0038939093 /DNA_START=175 /DNA_END=402 /DNA_ORIENTATION=-